MARLFLSDLSILTAPTYIKVKPAVITRVSRDLRGRYSVHGTRCTVYGPRSPLIVLSQQSNHQVHFGRRPMLARLQYNPRFPWGIQHMSSARQMKLCIYITVYSCVSTTCVCVCVCVRRACIVCICWAMRANVSQVAILNYLCSIFYFASISQQAARFYSTIPLPFSILVLCLFYDDSVFTAQFDEPKLIKDAPRSLA